MANRNMEEIAEKVKNDIPEDYKITVDEHQRLYELIVAGKWSVVIDTAFNYGFALGCRATRKKDVGKV